MPDEHDDAVIVCAAVGLVLAAVRRASRCCADRTSARRRTAPNARRARRRARRRRSRSRRRAPAVCACRAAFRALASAFSTKVACGSSASGTPSAACGTTSIPSGAKQLARTRAACRDWTMRGRAASPLLQTPSTARCFAISSRMPRSASATRDTISTRRERRALGRPLQLDEAAGAGHHHVHVGVAARVLGVVEVEHRHALVQADRHRGDEVANRRLGEESAVRSAPRSRRGARRSCR